MNFSNCSEENLLYQPKYFTEWRSEVLYGLAKWKNGLAFKKINFSNNGKPVIKIAELKNGLSAQTKYTRDEFDKSVFLTKGDMVFSWSGNPETSIDIFWYSLPDGWLNQHIFKVTVDNGIDEKFFYYILKFLKPNFTAIASNKQTTGLGHVTIGDLKNIIVKLPELEEQKAIARVLSTLDDKIEVNNQINKTLENMAQAIFKHWFVDFEFPNEDGEPYKSSGGEMIESELGMIPKGWKVSTVGELTAIVSKGTTPRKSDIDSATDNNCVKFLKVKDISDHGVIDLKGLEMIPSSIHLNQLKRSVLKYKDVLISIAGTIGRVSYVNEELVNANTNQAVAFIRLKDVEKHFLLMHYKFKSSDFQDSIRSKIVQGVQANISLSVIKDEKLILPDDNVLGLYNNVLNNIFNESNILYKEINSLTNIRDTLLPKLMSGEIRVPLDEECDAS